MPMISAWPGGNPRACVPSLTCGRPASLPAASTARNAATRTLMTIPALRTFDEQSVPLWPVRTVSVEMTLMTMLPADVETLMPRQTGAVPENHRAATTGSMAYMAITTSSIAHVRLTVTDIELSRQLERVRLASVDRGT